MVRKCSFSSAAASGWAGWALAHPEFGSSVNPITTRGADYAHHITASPPGFEIPAASLIFSEKATKLCEIFTLLLSECTVVKSKVKISKNCVAFSEYMNFTFFPIQSGIKTFLKSRKIFYSHAILASAMISSIKYEISHKIKFQCKFINLLTPWSIRSTTVTYVCKL